MESWSDAVETGFSFEGLDLTTTKPRKIWKRMAISRLWRKLWSSERRRSGTIPMLQSRFVSIGDEV